MQQAIRWNLFQLCQATWRAEGAGVPAKGLTGRRLRRPLLLGHRDLRAAVPRLHPAPHRPEPAALPPQHAAQGARAGRELDQRGALFPWRTINGEEASAYYQAGTAQYHLNADIAYAIRRYVDVRGDVGFLVEVGAEILVETARMWEDLGFYGDDGRFHIHGVTGPDEYTTVVNDNAFTNLMARLNLNYAAPAVRRLEAERPAASTRPSRFELSLEPDEIEAWERAAERDVRPLRRGAGITPAGRLLPRAGGVGPRATRRRRSSRCCCTTTRSCIYRHQVLKQADVVMAMFLLGNEFTLEQKRATSSTTTRSPPATRRCRPASRASSPPRSATSAAACRYFRLRPAHGPRRRGRQRLRRRARRLRRRGVDGAGVRLRRRARLRRPASPSTPTCPRRFDPLAFSLRFHDRSIQVTLTHAHETYVVSAGNPVEVAIRGETHQLATGVPLTLAAPGDD